MTDGNRDEEPAGDCASCVHRDDCTVLSPDTCGSRFPDAEEYRTERGL